MSDGNFNRALLPHTPYASGLKVGKAQERTHALKAFKLWLAAYNTNLSTEEIEQQCNSFAARLREVEI
ncbi:MAG: hypothetical protein J5486_03625 [Bacteroidaceae bacterium]|nr:hypothetical protein [Bacteroidaceae bacterium]